MKTNRIYNMDCLEGLKKLKNNSVKLFVADPPYFLGMTHNGQKGTFVDLAICKLFYEALLKEIKRVLTVDGSVYWFNDWRSYPFYYPVFSSVLKVNNLIVWDKIASPGTFYSFNHELIIFHTADKSFCRGGSSIWKFKAFSSGAQASHGKKVHPTQKPIEIIEKIVLENSQKGDLVCDLFSGSGTTSIVARKHQRDAIGFELDIANFDVLKRRVQEYQFVDV